MTCRREVVSGMRWNNGWHHGVGPWWWMFMALMMVAFWVGVVWLIITLIRHRGGSINGAAASPPTNRGADRPDPEDILHERLARGEIDIDEYHQRVDALRSKRSD